MMLFPLLFNLFFHFCNHIHNVARLTFFTGRSGKSQKLMMCEVLKEISSTIPHPSFSFPHQSLLLAHTKKQLHDTYYIYISFIHIGWPICVYIHIDLH